MLHLHLPMSLLPAAHIDQRAPARCTHPRPLSAPPSAHILSSADLAHTCCMLPQFIGHREEPPVLRPPLPLPLLRPVPFGPQAFVEPVPTIYITSSPHRHGRPPSLLLPPFPPARRYEYRRKGRRKNRLYSYTTTSPFRSRSSHTPVLSLRPAAPHACWPCPSSGSSPRLSCSTCCAPSLCIEFRPLARACLSSEKPSRSKDTVAVILGLQLQALNEERAGGRQIGFLSAHSTYLDWSDVTSCCIHPSIYSAFYRRGVV